MNGAKLRFTVDERHIALLRRAYVGWEGCEFGAPAIDCKRPYGNGSVLEDIAKILGLPPRPDDGYGDFPGEQEELMRALHRGTKTALQIFLCTGEMKAGEYETDLYHRRGWRRVT